MGNLESQQLHHPLPEPNNTFLTREDLELLLESNEVNENLNERTRKREQ